MLSEYRAFRSAATFSFCLVSRICGSLSARVERQECDTAQVPLRARGPKTVCFSHGQFRFVVETLCRLRVAQPRKRGFRRVPSHAAEPYGFGAIIFRRNYTGSGWIRYQFDAKLFIQNLTAANFPRGTPAVAERRRTRWRRTTTPRITEILLQQIRAHGPQVVLQQLRQARLLLWCEIRWPQPLRPRQDRLVPAVVLSSTPLLHVSR